ncbi:hypothetical protein COV93_03610 [Candidatus Woesearchaeota archaeon CG11_big_fil_rev_8_21_14_0_20_43_8]|nr:MAG: hypothetical protein COV93_03610 [Candidatus Woesearchaeota archaeon CG11_big_fil_rev_8_21_14_0_20_43_8]
MSDEKKGIFSQIGSVIKNKYTMYTFAGAMGACIANADISKTYADENTDPLTAAAYRLVKPNTITIGRKHRTVTSAVNSILRDSGLRVTGPQFINKIVDATVARDREELKLLDQDSARAKYLRQKIKDLNTDTSYILQKREVIRNGCTINLKSNVKRIRKGDGVRGDRVKMGYVLVIPGTETNCPAPVQCPPKQTCPAAQPPIVEKCKDDYGKLRDLLQKYDCLDGLCDFNMTLNNNVLKIINGQAGLDKKLDELLKRKPGISREEFNSGLKILMGLNGKDGKITKPDVLYSPKGSLTLFGRHGREFLDSEPLLFMNSIGLDGSYRFNLPDMTFILLEGSYGHGWGNFQKDLGGLYTNIAELSFMHLWGIQMPKENTLLLGGGVSGRYNNTELEIKDVLSKTTHGVEYFGRLFAGFDAKYFDAKIDLEIGSGNTTNDKTEDQPLLIESSLKGDAHLFRMGIPVGLRILFNLRYEDLDLQDEKRGNLSTKLAGQLGYHSKHVRIYGEAGGQWHEGEVSDANGFFVGLGLEAMLGGKK